MTLPRGAHLVGGLAAPNAAAAMSTAASILGQHLVRVTDGETGDRTQWFWWQIEKLTAVPGISLGSSQNFAEGSEEADHPGLDVEPGVAIPDRTLGYADAAIDSYADFARLREEGVIAEGVRFQVSLPTPYAVVVAWAKGEAQANLWQPYKDAMFAEARAIQDAVPAKDLAIQWDVAVEIGVLEGLHGAFDAIPELASFERIVQEVAECVALVKPPAQRGIHLCYGDYQHRHYVQPKDLSLVVRLANAVASNVSMDFVHMPVDRESGRSESYFDALRDLEVGDAELALGLIDYENDPGRTDELVRNANRAERPYLVATECGMSRIGERGEAVTLEDLLREHARIADPIR